MAVSAAASSPDPEELPGAAEAPGRHQPFEVDPRRTMLYRVERMLFVTGLWAWFRPKVVGREHIPTTGAAILAPVHRSFADFGFAAFCTERKLFFMTKDEMWNNKWLGKLLLTVGAFPVHRESADREALQRAEEVLRKGELLVLFPEGTRREGRDIEDLMEGAAFLSARTGAPIVPIGIGGIGPGHAQGERASRSRTPSRSSSAPPSRRRPGPREGGCPGRPCGPPPRRWSPSSRPSTTRRGPGPGRY